MLVEESAKGGLIVRLGKKKKALFCSTCLQLDSLPLAPMAGTTNPSSDGDSTQAYGYC